MAASMPPPRHVALQGHFGPQQPRWPNRRYRLEVEPTLQASFVFPFLLLKTAMLHPIRFHKYRNERGLKPATACLPKQCHMLGCCVYDLKYTCPTTKLRIDERTTV